MYFHDAEIHLWHQFPRDVIARYNVKFSSDSNAPGSVLLDSTRAP
jgi:hypothetical protein